MIRNLKVLGLALAAVFALSAVAASGAMAQNGVFTTETGQPETLIGVQTGEPSANQTSAFGLNWRCPTATYTGHEVGSLTNGVPHGAGEFTVTPHYGHCSVAGFPATVDMNNCDFELDFGETVGQHQYDVDLTVECPESQHVSLTIFTSAGHEQSQMFCEIEFTHKTAYSGLTATDTTNGVIDVTGTIQGVAAHKRPGHPTIFCPEQTTDTGTHTFDLEFEGKNGLGIGISD